jgi:hypothetical protein
VLPHVGAIAAADLGDIAPQRLPQIQQLLPIQHHFPPRFLLQHRGEVGRIQDLPMPLETARVVGDQSILG